MKEILEKEGLYNEENLSPKQLSDRYKITGLASFNMINLERWKKFKGGRIYYNATVDGAIGSSIPPQYDIRSAIKTHPVPITIIQGDQDYIDSGASYWKEIADNYSSVKIMPVQKSGHYIWLDKPEEFAELLKISINQKPVLNMKKDLEVSKSILINTSPQRVWEVMTNPEFIKEFLFGTEALTDWEVGNEVIFQGEYNGQHYKDKGVVLSNKPLEELSYSYWTGFSGLEDKPENYAKVIYTLQKSNGDQTEFTWTQKGYSSEENYKHGLDGMPGLLAKIKEIAERN